MRLFCALEVSSDVRAALTEAQNQLRAELEHSRLTWVAPENLHLTLKFFGETTNAKLPALENALEKSARQHPTMTVQLGKFGVFPGAKKPRVLWVAAAAQENRLSALAQSIDQETERAGFAPADPPFRAHLTLARIQSPHATDADANADAKSDVGAWTKILAAAPDFPAFNVDAVALIESRLHPAGPLYTCRKRFLLSS